MSQADAECATCSSMLAVECLCLAPWGLKRYLCYGLLRHLWLGLLRYLRKVCVDRSLGRIVQDCVLRSQRPVPLKYEK